MVAVTAKAEDEMRTDRKRAGRRDFIRWGLVGVGFLNNSRVRLCVRNGGRGGNNGGRAGIRTPDPLGVNEVL